VFADFGSESTK